MVFGKCVLRVRDGRVVFVDVEILIVIGCMFRCLNVLCILFGVGFWCKVEVMGDYDIYAMVFGKCVLRVRDGRVVFVFCIDCDLFAQDVMWVGQVVKISGSLKSGDNLIIVVNVCVEGVVFCGCDFVIGCGCHIWGSVLAEGRILIGSDCCIGVFGYSTMVSVLIILVGDWVVVFGSVWVRDGGAAIS